MMKRAQGILLLPILFVLSACSTTEASDNKGLDTLAPEYEMTITSSKIQVSELITKKTLQHHMIQMSVII